MNGNTKCPGTAKSVNPNALNMGDQSPRRNRRLLSKVQAVRALAQT
jgi:hypothetical protein